MRRTMTTLLCAGTLLMNLAEAQAIIDSIQFET